MHFGNLRVQPSFRDLLREMRRLFCGGTSGGVAKCRLFSQAVHLSALRYIVRLRLAPTFPEGW